MLILAVRVGIDVVAVLDVEVLELVELTDVDEDVVGPAGTVVVFTAETVVEADAVVVVVGEDVVVGATVVDDGIEVVDVIGGGAVTEPPQLGTSAVPAMLNASRIMGARTISREQLHRMWILPRPSE